MAECILRRGCFGGDPARFFEEEAGGSYTRYGEQFTERAYSHGELCAFAQAAGLTLAGYYEELTRTPPRADTERAVYVMKKERNSK